MAEIRRKIPLIKKRKSEWHLKKGTHKLNSRSDGGIVAPREPSKAEIAIKDIGSNILNGFKIMGTATISGLRKVGKEITSEEGLKKLGELGDNANRTFREPLNREFQIKPRKI